MSIKCDLRALIYKNIKERTTFVFRKSSQCEKTAQTEFSCMPFLCNSNPGQADMSLSGTDMLQIRSILPDFERNEGESSQYDRYNPEADCNFRLMPAVMRPLREITAVRVELLGQYAEVVMNGSTLEYTLLDSLTLAQLEVIDLKDYTETFEKENSAKQRQ